MSKSTILKLTDEESNLIAEDARDNMVLQLDQLPERMQSFLYMGAIDSSKFDYIHFTHT
jgi:hypothetical protein